MRFRVDRMWFGGVALAVLGALGAGAFAAGRPERVAYPCKTAVSAGGVYDNGSAVGTDFVVSGTIGSALEFRSDVPYRVTFDGATLSAPVVFGGEATLWLKGASAVSTSEAAALASTGALTIGGSGSLALEASPAAKATGVLNAADLTVAGGALSITLASQVKNACGIALTGNYVQLAGSVSIDASGGDSVKVNGLLVNAKKKSVSVSGGTLSVSVDGPKSIGISLDKASTAMSLSGGVVALTVAGDGAKGIKSGKDDCRFSMSGGLLNASVSGGVVVEPYEDGDGNHYAVSVSSTALFSRTGSYVVQDVSAALRRANAAPAGDAGETFRIGDALVDAARFLVRAPGEPEQALTVRELGLLKVFAAHPGKVLTRDALLDAVWGEDYFAASRTLDQHIVQIRRKLGASGARIETVRGAGYRLKA